MSFNIAISGLNAAQSDLSTTANNIANAGTTGFKNGRAQFSDIFTRGSAINGGAGVRVSGVKQDFNQGSIEFTGNELDLAIAGSGFFVLKDDNGARSYSRSGAFEVNSNGKVVNSAGQKLQIYNSKGNNAEVGDLTVSKLLVEPKKTAEVRLAVTLPVNSELKSDSGFDAADPSTYNHSFSTEVYDSLGVAHTTTVFLYKTGIDTTTNNGKWSIRVSFNGEDPSPATSVEFNQSGAVVKPTAKSFEETLNPTNGAATVQKIKFDLSGATQLGSLFSVNAVKQDGYTAGRLTGVSVDPQGVINGTYSNGNIESLGQLVIANFNGVDSLQQTGNGNWVETVASGPALLGTPGAAGFGQIESNSLEASNVDMTKELVHMITAQRNFQANAKLISASDQLAQTIINLR